jgi:hypothetical protein
MVFRIRYLCIFVLPFFLLSSCLHSKTSAQTFSVSKTVKINSGSVILKINGQINENLYAYDPDKMLRDRVNYYDNPLIGEGTITKNEIKYLSTGGEYKFFVLPTEVVTINFKSFDGNDAEISIFENGKERIYIIEGTNMLGLFIAFQNR